ncbi:MAG: hypothetical protein KC910_22870 [Candidatus Eremiobacteraeota bacterium]|nr:hypothetical protein [Candidatus Eremiobacteraeota bacterium]
MSLLLEAVFGLGLVAVAVLLVFGLFPTSQRSTTTAKNMATATNLARQELERQLLLPYASVVDAPPVPLPAITGTVNGVSSDTQFQLEVKTEEYAANERKGVLVVVSWDESGRHREARLEGLVVRY